MRKAIILILLLGCVKPLSAQTDLDAMLATTSDKTLSKKSAQDQLNAFLQPLTTSKLSEQRLLKKAFHQIQHTFLKHYESYSDFEDIFSSGRYDCLTGTALCSYVLNQLNYSFEIIETNYHIFLVVKTSGGNVLLETTDRMGGFVTGEEAIATRIEGYRKNVLEANQSKDFFYQYSCRLYQRISPDKLTGLMYFNQAVKAYNQHDWIHCSALLETAQGLYASPRCEELGVILIKTLLQSSMDVKAKEACLSRVRHFWVNRSQPLASN